jgi:hypothetical protein
MMSSSCDETRQSELMNSKGVKIVGSRHRHPDIGNYWSAFSIGIPTIVTSFSNSIAAAASNATVIFLGSRNRVS